MNNKKIIKTVTVAMLSAMAFVLYLFEFQIIPGNSYLKIDLSDIPALAGGIIAGPWAVIAIEGIKNIIELAVRGIGTQMGFGNIMNFIVGCSYALTFSFTFKKLKEKNSMIKTDVISSLLSLAVITVLGFGANYLIAPLFFKVFLKTEITHEVLMTAVYSATVLNLIKGALLSVVSYPIIEVAERRIKWYK